MSKKCLCYVSFCVPWTKLQEALQVVGYYFDPIRPSSRNDLADHSGVEVFVLVEESLGFGAKFSKFEAAIERVWQSSKPVHWGVLV